MLELVASLLMGIWTESTGWVTRQGGPSPYFPYFGGRILAERDLKMTRDFFDIIADNGRNLHYGQLVCRKCGIRFPQTTYHCDVLIVCKECDNQEELPIEN